MLLFIQLLEYNLTTITRNQNMLRLSIKADVSFMGRRNIWITQRPQMYVKPKPIETLLYAM